MALSAGLCRDPTSGNRFQRVPLPGSRRWCSASSTALLWLISDPTRLLNGEAPEVLIFWAPVSW
ncbi:MAG: hypothetical protein R2838_15490 [Caldilineaceae bacterium]